MIKAQKSPCANCPWRKDIPPGEFPPERFRATAGTAYDAAIPLFACHKSKDDDPVTCAGFLLRHGVHNLSVRLNQLQGFDLGAVSDRGLPLHATFREMAIANGVDPADPLLIPIRGNDE